MRGILIYEHNCNFCRRMAKLTKILSGEKIELVPYGSKQAEELLKVFYPNGHPYSFFLITLDGYLYTGFKAILRWLKLFLVGK
ncbi:MAG: hypothetical protein ACP6IP_03620 [Candidatus Njordarchaeia archaeon]